MEMQRKKDYFSSSSSFVSSIPTLFDLVHSRLAYTLIAHGGGFAMILEDNLFGLSYSGRTSCCQLLLYTRLKISRLVWVFDGKYLTR